MVKSNLQQLLPTYHDYLIYEKGHSVYKSNSYIKLLKILSQDLSLPLTLEDCRQVVLRLKKTNHSPGYINHVVTCLNSFTRFLLTQNIGQINFTADLNKIRPKDDRTPDPNDLLSVEEVAALINTPKNRPSQNNALNDIRMAKVDKMWNLFLSLNYKMASRSGEIAKLRKKDINFSNHSLTFYATKTGDNRTVAIPPDMEEELKEYLKPLNDTDYLFTASSGPKAHQPISQEMSNRIIRNRARYAGIERPVHVHMLRHSAITHYLINGAPLATVQAICGHKRLATTQLYTHILVENQREVMLKFNPLVRSNQSPTQIYNRTEEFVSNLHLEETGVLSKKFINNYLVFVKNILENKLLYKTI